MMREYMWPLKHTHYLILKKIIHSFYVYVFLRYAYVPTCTGTHGRQRTQVPLTVGSTIWVLETKSGLSLRGAGNVNH